MRIQDKKVYEWDNGILNSVGIFWGKIEVEDSTIFNSICMSTIVRCNVSTSMAVEMKVYAGKNEFIKHLIYSNILCIF